ncbi:MAG TPA: hypothetical protein VIL26_07465 [Clostridia bacterium]
MSEAINKRGIKTVLRKMMKGKNMNIEAQTDFSSVTAKKPIISFKIADANEDEIPFGWKNDISYHKKGKKSFLKLSKKIISQITPRTKKDN